MFDDERIRIGIIVVLAGTLLFAKLGENGLANYDDCFYAQKAKEVLASGNWMTLTFNIASSPRRPST